MSERPQFKLVQVTPFVPKKWRLSIGGDYGLHIGMPDAPNWFHRTMQRLILGFKYERLPDDSSDPQ